MTLKLCYACNILVLQTAMSAANENYMLSCMYLCMYVCMCGHVVVEGEVRQLGQRIDG